LLKAPQKPTDERLEAERSLIAAARSDPSRFAELYENHFERVYAYVLRRVASRQEAEDVTSDVFHQALANIGKFEWRGAPFSAWLLRIAANATADKWRKRAREQGNPGKEASEEFDFESSAEQARLFHLVKELPAEQRLVIQMRFAEEKSIREIAQAIGKTEGAVKQLQFRGIQNLRQMMGSKKQKNAVKKNA
jgi:RNA polymerase sigma-70 factor, ECF subfamily